MPQQRDARKRPHNVRIYLSDDELERMKDKAAAEKLGMSDYLRRLAGVEEPDPSTGKMAPVHRRGRRGKTVSPTADIRLLGQLSWIGNNLNQMSRVMNTAKVSGRAIDIVRFAADLNSMKEELDHVLRDIQTR